MGNVPVRWGARPIHCAKTESANSLLENPESTNTLSER